HRNPQGNPRSRDCARPREACGAAEGTDPRLTVDNLRKAAKAVLEWNVAAAGWVLGSAWNAIAPAVLTPRSHSLEVVRENMPILAYRIAYLEVRCDYKPHPKSKSTY